MRSIVEISGLEKHLNGRSSERAVQALKRLVCLGMQEVSSVEIRASEKDAGNCWRDEFFKIKCAIASDPNASPLLLNRLARCYEPEVLERIAENPQTDPHTLACLGTVSQAEVRMAVVENGNTPLATLVALAFDESVDVRFRLAENHNVSQQILELLTDDDNPYVSWRAQSTLERLQPPGHDPFWCAA